MISAGVAHALHRTIEWQTRSPKSAEGRTAARYGTGVPFANLTDDRRLFFYAPWKYLFLGLLLFVGTAQRESHDGDRQAGRVR
jgi:hypothetical protein